MVGFTPEQIARLSKRSASWISLMESLPQVMGLVEDVTPREHLGGA